MKVRHELEANGKPCAQDVDARLRRISANYGGLHAGAESGRLPHDCIRHDENALAAVLSVGAYRNSEDEWQCQTNSQCKHRIPSLLSTWSAAGLLATSASDGGLPVMWKTNSEGAASLFPNCTFRKGTTLYFERDHPYQKGPVSRPAWERSVNRERARNGSGWNSPARLKLSPVSSVGCVPCR